MSQDMQKKLDEYRLKFGPLQKFPCTKEENAKYRQLLIEGKALPDGVYSYDLGQGIEAEEFYTIKGLDITAEEREEYLAYKKLELLSTIKNCVVFFTVLTVAALIIALFGNLLGM